MVLLCCEISIRKSEEKGIEGKGIEKKDILCLRSSCTLVVISLFLSYNMDTGGGLDEIQDFSCR